MDTFSNKKFCKTCNIEKDLSNFHKNKTCVDGFMTNCKQCFNSKRREKYQPKLKQEDETLLEKQKFIEEGNKIHQKISECSDPDELDKLGDNYMKILQIYKQILLEGTSTSNINVLNENQDDEEIQGRLQEFFQTKKIILPLNEVIIERLFQIIKIHLPDQYKLNKTEILTLTKSMKKQ